MPNRLKRRETLKQRLRRGSGTRQDFVSSHVAKAVAFQIRAMRDREGWSQAELARRCGTTQNQILRSASITHWLEIPPPCGSLSMLKGPYNGGFLNGGLTSPNYGKPSITTLKKIAGVFDVALVVRYVKFSELVDWVAGLGEESVLVPSFQQEQEQVQPFAQDVETQSNFGVDDSVGVGPEDLVEASLTSTHPGTFHTTLDWDLELPGGRSKIVPAGVLIDQDQSLGIGFESSAV